MFFRQSLPQKKENLSDIFNYDDITGIFLNKLSPAELAKICRANRKIYAHFQKFKKDPKYQFQLLKAKSSELLRSLNATSSGPPLALARSAARPRPARSS